jgi:hypothetical protein
LSGSMQIHIASLFYKNLAAFTTYPSRRKSCGDRCGGRAFGTEVPENNFMHESLLEDEFVEARGHPLAKSRKLTVDLACGMGVAAQGQARARAPRCDSRGAALCLRRSAIETNSLPVNRDVLVASNRLSIVSLLRSIETNDALVACRIALHATSVTPHVGVERRVGRFQMRSPGPAPPAAD